MNISLSYYSAIGKRKINEDAVSVLESSGRESPMAHYYLGELLYDKKQYAQAIFRENGFTR